MNPFKILKIRKTIKEARENPSALAGEEIRGVLWGLFVIPIIIGALVVVLFFLIGYTDVLGFTWGFFKILFWISLFVSLAIFSVVKKIIKAVGKGATVATKKVVDVVGQEVGDEKGV